MRAILAAGRQEGDELVSTFWCVASGCNHVRAEMLRENKRMLDKAIRELDRERMSLQQQEKKTIVEIKKMAKEGQMVRCAAWLGKPPPLPPPPTARTSSKVLSAHPAACVCVAMSVCAVHNKTGCCQGHGQVPHPQQACSHQAARPQIAAAGGVAQDPGVLCAERQQPVCMPAGRQSSTC